MRRTRARESLSDLQREVMRVIWDKGPSTADQVRRGLAPAHVLKDSTVRTLLSRLEEKGFLAHRTAGRTYVYRPLVRPRQAAARAVRQVIDRFCGGSVEELLVGLVDEEVMDEALLERLARRVRHRDDDVGESDRRKGTVREGDPGDDKSDR